MGKLLSFDDLGQLVLAIGGTPVLLNEMAAKLEQLDKGSSKQRVITQFEDQRLAIRHKVASARLGMASLSDFQEP